jgi:hypothetical protein
VKTEAARNAAAPNRAQRGGKGAAAKEGVAAKKAEALKKTQATKKAATKAQATKRVEAAKRGAAAKAPGPVRKSVASRRRASKPAAIAEPPVPKQGYEPEDELELGKPVNPPSGAELVESVADIFGELANSGLTAGGRLLKDAFSLLRRP